MGVTSARTTIDITYSCYQFKGGHKVFLFQSSFFPPLSFLRLNTCLGLSFTQSFLNVNVHQPSINIGYLTKKDYC